MSSISSIADWAADLQKVRALFDGGFGPFPARLIEQAERQFAELMNDGSPPMLNHGNMNWGNILCGQLVHLELVLRTRSIIRKNGFAGEATWLIVPARYKDRDRHVKANDPVVPECPTNSGSGCREKNRGSFR